jgi:hypothetical protein
MKLVSFSHGRRENSSFVVARRRPYLALVIGANMKTRTALTAAELYALERAARRARSLEMARLTRAAARALSSFARRAVSAAPTRMGIRHA